MIILSSLLSSALAAPVFIIEDGAPEVDDMVLSLEAYGHTVSVSSDFGFLEYEFTGEEVDLEAYDVVLWMDGEGSAAFSMAEEGQWALHDYVLGGGGVVLFGQNGFNYLSGKHDELAALIPVRSWWVDVAGWYRPLDEEHPLGEGFSEDEWTVLSGAEIRDSTRSFGLLTWNTYPGWDETFVGSVAFEEGEGRGVQWALWGNAGSSVNQTDWADDNVAMMLDNSVRWAGQGPPRVDAGGPYVVDAGDWVELDGSGSTPRGDSALETYTWEVDGLVLDDDGAVVMFDTAGYDGPVVLDVTLMVLDDEGRSGTDTTTLMIENAPPDVLDMDCALEGTEGESLGFRASAEDPEAADTLSYAWWTDDTPLGVGEEVVITFAQDGDYDVEVAVTDDDGATTWAVCPGPVVVENVAPEITGDPPGSVDAGSSYRFTPGLTDPGVLDEHVWSVDGPAGLSVNPLTGEVTWEPSIEDVGTSTALLTVTDGLDEGTKGWEIVVRWPDVDGDGVRGDEDCDDADPEIYPGAAEACDDIDSDCDGTLVDEFEDMDDDGSPDCIDADADGDGFDDTLDCDDADAAVYPGAVEACDFDDSDCDGSVADEFPDADGDDLPDCVDEDSDDDGLPDAYEEEVGLDPEDGTDASSDEDGDGRTALEEFEAGTDPTVYEGPGVPSPYLPADGGELTTLPAVLVVINGGAPLGQELTHGMLLGLESTLETVVASVDGLSGSPDGETTGWLLDTELEENTWYYWTAWAQDDYTVGDAMAPSSFFVNQFNEAPGAPGLDRPLDGALASDVELVAIAPDDPDLDAVQLVFTLELEEGTRISSVEVEPVGGFASWTPPLDFEDGDEFCWSAYAIDEHGLDGPASEAACFSIETSDLPPTAPDLQTPADEVVSTLTPEFVVTNGVDPEGRATTHLFEVDLSPTFDSEALQSAEVDSGDDGQTSWSPEVPLEEDAWIYVRVLCSDGVNNSDWALAEFFVSATNDPPSVPVLLNPADGVGLSESQRLEVTLSVDPEGDAVTHDLMVMDLRDQVVAEAEAVETESEVVSWDPGAIEVGHYQWTSRAVDASGVASDWAQPRSFYVGSPDYAVQPELDGVQDYSKTEGCSCSQGPVRGQWVWWALGALGLIQRRKRPRC